ncbi:uncharacterized protein LOC126882628 [Diabrotica virgifera virgifera]|uniref:HAT C-terminal dimerisation domain-containing protein n=1 Tax=Diabrotica virgifera virgifera TaxID=50390 RepID=A0ABM5K045_DIAVI|nr:uncharacterized protein LOC126882628 [Diabrotica virgifera virgifera]
MLRLELTSISQYSYDLKRKPLRKTRSDETKQGGYVPSDGSENFRVKVFNVILDVLYAELKRRSETYTVLWEKIYFLENLLDLDGRTITKFADKLVELYAEDLESVLADECMHLKEHLKISNYKGTSASELNAFLHKKDLGDVYPNVNITVRILLSIPVTNCSGERSLSVLKRVKNCLRSTTRDERLSPLVLLAIEKSITKNLDCENIINVFAEKKTRKKVF